MLLRTDGRQLRPRRRRRSAGAQCPTPRSLQPGAVTWRTRKLTLVPPSRQRRCRQPARPGAGPRDRRRDHRRRHRRGHRDRTASTCLVGGRQVPPAEFRRRPARLPADSNRADDRGSPSCPRDLITDPVKPSSLDGLAAIWSPGASRDAQARRRVRHRVRQADRRRLPVGGHRPQWRPDDRGRVERAVASAVGRVAHGAGPKPLLHARVAELEVALRLEKA